MKRTVKYDVFNDPGHGWMKVTRNEINRLGIAEKISPYSYQRGDHVYLEEDGDLTKFRIAKMEIDKIKIEFREKHSNKSSKIRSYWGYKVEA